jgi:hypothetical protein
MTAKLIRWADTLLASPAATRSQFAEIAQAAERLASPELVPTLLTLLAEDLERKRRAMEELLEARKQRRHLQNDARMCWTLQYQRAFSAIGDGRTIDAMKNYLLDPEFGFEAAHVLKAVWRKSQSTLEEADLWRSWPDFSVVPEAHKARQLGASTETHPFVDNIIAAINELIVANAPEAQHLHALKLATVAFSMPYADKRETINTLLKLPVRTSAKNNLLTVLVLAGEAISSDTVLKGIDDLLEQARSRTWMLQENDGWRLKNWLRLLPFTDRPAAVLDVLERAEDFCASPWNLRFLLSALSYAPSQEAEVVLYELGKRDERFLQEHDWVRALADRNTLSASRYLLDSICTASSTGRRGRIDHYDLSRRLAELMVRDHQFRQDIYERLPALDDGSARSVLESAIAEAPDFNGIVLLVHQSAEMNQPFRSTVLYKALRNVLIGETSIGSSGRQRSHSLPAPGLRKDLFAMIMSGNDTEKRLAVDCLRAIDEIRDDYGQVDSEPRHPDITTGVPWPILEPDYSR